MITFILLDQKRIILKAPGSAKKWCSFPPNQRQLVKWMSVGTPKIRQWCFLKIWVSFPTITRFWPAGRVGGRRNHLVSPPRDISQRCSTNPSNFMDNIRRCCEISAQSDHVKCSPIDDTLERTLGRKLERTLGRKLSVTVDWIRTYVSLEDRMAYDLDQ